jgi:hypothetical protein
MRPMKLTDVGSDRATVQRYIEDDDYVMQQKLDGARMLVVYTDGQPILFTNDGVNSIKFAAAVQKLSALTVQLTEDFMELGIDKVILDGELIIETGVYHVWDVTHLVVDYRLEKHDLESDYNPNRVDGQEDWEWRDSVLRDELEALAHDLVQFSETARTRSDKEYLWARINSTNVEGAVSKLRSSVYEEGTRTKDWVKHKLVKTADVVVTKVDRTFKADGKTLSHGKAELAVSINPLNDPQPYVNAKGKRIEPWVYHALPESKRKAFELSMRSSYPVGNASLIGRELTIEVGSVVEVNYLYFDSAMIQPRIVRQRWDKQPRECDMDQFPAYTRRIVTL